MNESLPLLAAIIEATDDAVVSIDTDGLITTWNPAASSLYGYAAEEVLGRPVSVLVPTADGDGLRRALLGEKVAHAEVPRLRKDGSTVAVGETVSPVRDAAGEVAGAVMVARDIGTRLELEQALSVARRELEAQNRQLTRSNAELEQFAYVASHDLSEPLRAVAGMVGLLERRYRGRLDQDADEFIAFAVEGCERMRALIEDLLSFSRAGRVELKIQEVDAADVVTSVVQSLDAVMVDAGAVVTVEELPVVSADRSQLAQVLQNLVSNAVKFRREDVAPAVRVAATREPAGWRFLVSDNGIGIEEQYRAKIFRMFQRLHTREAYPGTGIGLAIAERIVDRHGGQMGVQSNDAGGSTFWFTIPDRAEATRP